MEQEPDFVRALLPAGLKPQPGVPLVRIGRGHDGGYLVDRRNLERADLLISMGINTDWSFEEQFLAQREVQLFAYDGSVSARDFFVEFYTRLALFEPRNARLAWQRFAGFRRFFNQTTRVHRCNFVSRDDGMRHISLDTILNDDVGETRRNIFFKIDIEGSEYHLLDALLACADRIEGATIEFHDVDRNMKRILAFVDAFPLTLCHVHGNNYSVVLDDGTPIVIECSFTRQPADASKPLKLPHPLDRPCRPGRPELVIEFSGMHGPN
ncbi:MAG: FkbM family methyltransferase [Rhodobacter sp.]|nr:FkbM family methyltransferase [Rhodobacter sp.]